MALALVRNYDSFKSPTHFKLTDLLKKFDKTFGATKSAEKGKCGSVEGDRTMDDIDEAPRGSLELPVHRRACGSRISSTTTSAAPRCASSRMPRSRAKSPSAPTTPASAGGNIIEKMHMTATLTKWYEEHGRHEIFAGNKAVPLNSTEHSLKLNEEAVRKGAPDRPRRSRHRQERS